MKLLGNVVIFRSAEPFFSREAKGLKSNTVKLLTNEEYEWLREHKPDLTLIRIENAEEPFRYVERKLTDISEIGELLGSKIVVFSWEAAELKRRGGLKEQK